MAQALIDAAVTFCEDSLVVRHRLDATTQRALADEVDLDLPANQSVARILGVWVNGNLIQPVLAEQAGDTVATGMPTAYYTRRNDSELQLLLYPTPDQPCRVAVEVALRPLRTAKLLEDELLDRWMPAVITGALALIRAIPDTPFSNPLAATLHARDAALLTAKARAEGAYGRVRGSQSVAMRPFI
jgi:hypothetical protein